LPFVLRRTKEQVTDLQGRPLFRKREVKTLSVHLTEAEKRLYEAVTAYVRRWYAAISGKTDRRSRNVALALTILQRRLSSSLFAVQESLRRRKSKLKNLREEWERPGPNYPPTPPILQPFRRPRVPPPSQKQTEKFARRVGTSPFGRLA